MLASIALDDDFLDRPGCGDELYLDSRLKAAQWLACTKSAPLELDLDLDIDFSEDGDAFAAH